MVLGSIRETKDQRHAQSDLRPERALHPRWAAQPLHVPDQPRDDRPDAERAAGARAGRGRRGRRSPAGGEQDVAPPVGDDDERARPGRRLASAADRVAGRPGRPAAGRGLASAVSLGGVGHLSTDLDASDQPLGSAGGPTRSTTGPHRSAWWRYGNVISIPLPKCEGILRPLTTPDRDDVDGSDASAVGREISQTYLVCHGEARIERRLTTNLERAGEHGSRCVSARLGGLYH